MSIALELNDLRKAFATPAVNALSLTVQHGEIFALLGPNGAGKTTTLRMIAGLLRPDSGAITINGINALTDPVAAKRAIAWLPDEPLLYDSLTPLEYLAFIAGLWQVPATLAAERAETLLRRLDLWTHRDQRCESFSRGMRQKTMLAGALLHDPALLILDEPLTGLDAIAARDVKEMLHDHASNGGSVLLTTHILDVAERLADRIGIIRQGRLVECGRFAEIAARHPGLATLEDIFIRLMEPA